MRVVDDDAARAQARAVAEFLELLNFERRDDAWVGRTPDWYGPVVFGGIGLAMTTRAACQDAPDGTRLHSMHGHFLRPVQGGRDIEVRHDVLKAGRTFTTHVVTALQEARPVIVLTCSFTSDTDGYVCDLSGIPEGVPKPDDVAAPDDAEREPGAGDARWLGPSEPRVDGTRGATHRHWFRFGR